jgi:hypothetical protein
VRRRSEDDIHIEDLKDKNERKYYIRQHSRAKALTELEKEKFKWVRGRSIGFAYTKAYLFSSNAK